MAKDVLLNFRSKTGEYFKIGTPGSLPNIGVPLALSNAEAYEGWLQNNFQKTFGQQRQDWKALDVQQQDACAIAEPANKVFPRIAGALANGELVVMQRPPEPPGEGGGYVGPAASAPRVSGPSQAATEGVGGDSEMVITVSMRNPAISDMQCQGDPVAPVTGEEILELTDFDVAAPMPLR